MGNFPNVAVMQQLPTDNHFKNPLGNLFNQRNGSDKNEIKGYIVQDLFLMCPHGEKFDLNRCKVAVQLLSKTNEI